MNKYIKVKDFDSYLKKLKKSKEWKNGWPDRIVGNHCIEDKKYPDIMSAEQIMTHEWLQKQTGRYPLVYYTNKSGKLLKFKSYKEFQIYCVGQRGRRRELSPEEKRLKSERLSLTMKKIWAKGLGSPGTKNNTQF